MGKCLNYDEMRWLINERLFVRGSGPESTVQYIINYRHVRECDRCSNLFNTIVEYADSVSHDKDKVWSKLDELFYEEFLVDQSCSNEENDVIGILDLVNEKIENWTSKFRCSFRPSSLPALQGGEDGDSGDISVVTKAEAEGEGITVEITCPEDVNGDMKLGSFDGDVIEASEKRQYAEDHKSKYIFKNMSKAKYQILH